MSSDAHLLRFETALKTVKFDVIGLSEVKREGEELIERSDFLMYSFTKSRKRGSVGFAVNKRWKNQVKIFKGLSDRVAILELQLEAKTFGFIQCYAPTSRAKDEEIDEFYDSVNEALRDTSNCDYLIVMGDFNAKVGQSDDSNSDIMGKFGYGIQNERGDRLINFARVNKLHITNSMFMKNEKRRSTWACTKANNEIDFILIKTEHKQLVRNIDVLNKFDYDSDHKMVRMEMSMDLKVKRPNKIRFKSYAMSGCKKASDKFNRDIKECVLRYNPNDMTIQNKYSMMCSAIIEAGDIYSRRNNKQAVISHETKSKIAERESLLKLRNQSQDAEMKFRAARKAVNKMIARDIRKFEIDQMNSAIENGSSWKNAKEGFKKGKNWIPKLSDKNGVLETDRDAILEFAA